MRRCREGRRFAEYQICFWEGKCIILKKWMIVLCALMLCVVLLFSACSGKQDTPFSQPAQGGAPAAPSDAQQGVVTDPAPGEPTDPVHPFGSASTEQPSASSGASSTATGGASSSAQNQSGNTASSSGSQTGSGTQSTGSRGATVRADGGLRLRSSASTDSETLLTIPDGTHLTCTGWKDGWAQTTYDGKSGYVSATYILLDGKVSANGGLRLRSGPGETYDRLLTIPDGTTLAFTEEKDGWLKTTYEGKTGYVSQDYIAISATVNAGPGLNLRETASESSTKLTTIPNGSIVQCIGSRSGDWVRVKYNSYEGYVSAQYLSFS